MVRGAGVVAAVWLLLAAMPASAASDQPRPRGESLRGLTDVLVLVEEVDPAAVLRSAMRLRLRS